MPQGYNLLGAFEVIRLDDVVFGGRKELGMKTVLFNVFWAPATGGLAGLIALLCLVVPSRHEGDLAEQLHGVLATQQRAWNQGNIPQFMDAYWKSQELTFSSGGKTTRGWQATLDRYTKRYPDRATMGVLSFEKLESIPLDANAALTLGVRKLQRDKPAEGNFTLVWKKIDGQWKIVHDHSSALSETN